MIRSVIGAIVAVLAGAPAGAAPVQLDFAAVYQKVKPSVVYIVVATASGAQSGSGFVYDSDASHTIIATADHVVAGGQRIDVIFDSNVKLRYRAQLLEHDRHSDVAFLDVAVGNRVPLRLMERPQIQEGSTIAAVGYPRAARAFENVVGDDLRPSVHGGIVSAIRLNGDIIQVDAEIDHGDSGGPVVDVKTGRVVGIVDASLLDPAYAARGLEKPLPGSNYAVSAPLIYAVRNGLIRIPATGTTPVAAAQPGSAAAYRVAFVTLPINTQTGQAIENVLTQRIREHFTGGNSFFAIPASGLSYTETSKMLRFCDDNRVNAIVIPYFGFRADGAQAGSASVAGTLIVADCSGIPFFIVNRSKNESRMFANRSQVREIIDMGNDVVDQMLAEFERYRDAHEPEWRNLLTSGIAIDPSSKRKPVSVGVLKEGKQFRIAFLREGGRGVTGGLLAGDLIVTIDGDIPPADATPFSISQRLETARSVQVRRPDGEKLIAIPEQ